MKEESYSVEIKVMKIQAKTERERNMRRERESRD